MNQTKTLSALMMSLMLLAGTSLFAQLKTPAPSPSAEMEQTIGLTEVKVEYSRPGAKDREVFGKLVPYGEMWRTGANASTKVTFSEDVKLEGKEVPKGTYALYTIPGEKEWTVVVHKNTTYWGVDDKYDEAEDQVRFMVKPEKSERFIETFTIGFEHLRNTHAHMVLSWENTRVPIKIEVNTSAAVEKEIKQKMAGVTARTYYDAANYYFAEGKDMDQALEWAQKAVSMEEKFWMVTLVAKIQGKMGNYDEAIKTSTHAIELAKEAEYMPYVRMNEGFIAEWKEAMKKG
ncbi:MAG: DUF2911 domain-containing protein [Bacteroidota bacterium]